MLVTDKNIKGENKKMKRNLRILLSISIDILTVAMIILSVTTIHLGRTYPNIKNKLKTIPEAKIVSIETNSKTTKLKLDTEQSISYFKTLKLRDTTKKTPITLTDGDKTQITRKEYNLLNSKTLQGQKGIQAKIDKNINIMNKVLMAELLLAVFLFISAITTYIETKKKYNAVCEAIDQLEEIKNKMENEEKSK